MAWLEPHWQRITPVSVLLYPLSLLFRAAVALRRAVYRAGLPDVLLTAQVFLKLLSLADIQTLDVLRAKASPFSLSWRSK